MTQDANRIVSALKLIQEAQNLLAGACRELCPLSGIGNAYDETCRIHDIIKDHWHNINDLTGPILHRMKKEVRP